MNISEKIALDCAAKIKKPFVDTFFIPIVQDKFIVIDTKSRFQFGRYDYYNDVIELIKPFLEKNKISIFQLSSDSCPQINCSRRFINISKKQEAYIISKSVLVVANENYSLYLASSLNVKSIGLYSIYNSENLRPVWNKASQTIIESNRNGNRPSYNSDIEKCKMINLINPFLIAKTILNNLNIENDLDKYSLIHLGENYNQKIIEVVPDFISNENFLQNQIINLRFDMVDTLTLQTVYFWLNNRKVNIITNRNLNLNPFIGFLQNILSITVIMSSSISEDFLNECKKLGLKIKLLCDNENEINNYRFKFLDWEILPDFRDGPKISELKGINEQSKFISSKILISRGKKYSCEANFISQKPLDKQPETVVNSSVFEKDIKYFKIFNER